MNSFTWVTKGKLYPLTGRCSDCCKVQSHCPHFSPPGEMPAAERLDCTHFKPKEAPHD